MQTSFCHADLAAQDEDIIFCTSGIIIQKSPPGKSFVYNLLSTV